MDIYVYATHFKPFDSLSGYFVRYSFIHFKRFMTSCINKGDTLNERKHHSRNVRYIGACS